MLYQSTSYVEIPVDKVIEMCEKTIDSVKIVHSTFEHMFFLKVLDKMNKRWWRRLFKLKLFTLNDVRKMVKDGEISNVVRLDDDEAGKYILEVVLPQYVEYPCIMFANTLSVAEKLLCAAKESHSCMVHVSIEDFSYISSEIKGE